MNRLAEVALLFARLGITSFGGPAAHIAMMRREVVLRKKWMDDSTFIDMVGATNLIPGPNSTELALHIGKERAGTKGLMIAGALFILPAICLTIGFAWLYKKYSALPEVFPFIYGIKPAILAIILAAIWPLAKTAAKNRELIIVGILSVILSFFINEIITLFCCGLAYAAYKKLSGNLPAVVLPFFSLLSAGKSGIFFTFLKIGATLYGSGYVLFAFIEREFVSKGLISSGQLADAIAVGQITPGPVFSSAAFIGYLLEGSGGAMAAAAGIFLPSFIFVALLGYILQKSASSMGFKAFLDAVNIASVGVIMIVCWKMAGESLQSWQTVLISLVSLALLYFFPKVNTAFIVIFGSLSGYCLLLI